MLFKLGFSYAWSWLNNGGIQTLAGIYAKYKDSADASERMHAEWAKAQLDAMTANRNATSGFWEMRLLTFLIAAPFVLHVLLVGLDTCFAFGWGIAKWPPPFDDYEGRILLSFFGLTAVTALAKALRG